MPDLKDYQLKGDLTYEESVRAGPTDEKGDHCYSIHFSSNMVDGDPLRDFLNARALEIARDLASILKQDIILKIGVQREEPAD